MYFGLSSQRAGKYCRKNRDDLIFENRQCTAASFFSEKDSDSVFAKTT
jgi:hypothetical protein